MAAFVIRPLGETGNFLVYEPMWPLFLRISYLVDDTNKRCWVSIRESLGYKQLVHRRKDDGTQNVTGSYYR